jgi:hypothetical protein
MDQHDLGGVGWITITSEVNMVTPPNPGGQRLAQTAAVWLAEQDFVELGPVRRPGGDRELRLPTLSACTTLLTALPAARVAGAGTTTVVAGAASCGHRGARESRCAGLLPPNSLPLQLLDHGLAQFWRRTTLAKPKPRPAPVSRSLTALKRTPSPTAGEQSFQLLGVQKAVPQVADVTGERSWKGKERLSELQAARTCFAQRLCARELITSRRCLSVMPEPASGRLSSTASGVAGAVQPVAAGRRRPSSRLRWRSSWPEQRAWGPGPAPVAGFPHRPAAGDETGDRSRSASARARCGRRASARNSAMPADRLPGLGALQLVLSERGPLAPSKSLPLLAPASAPSHGAGCGSACCNRRLLRSAIRPW